MASISARLSSDCVPCFKSSSARSNSVLVSCGLAGAATPALVALPSSSPGTSRLNFANPEPSNRRPPRIVAPAIKNAKTPPAPVPKKLPMAILACLCVRMNLSNKSSSFRDHALTPSHFSFSRARAKRKSRRSKRQDLACTGHDNLCRMALHRRDEMACVLIEKIEGPVVAGDNGIEFEETLDRERRRPPAHGETVADRHKTDLGRMDLRDQTHVGEYIGIAHVIKARRVPRRDDNAVRTPEIDGLAVDDRSRRMQRLGEAHAERAAINRAPGVAGVDIFRALGVQIHANFEIRN